MQSKAFKILTIPQCDSKQQLKYNIYSASLKCAPIKIVPFVCAYAWVVRLIDVPDKMYSKHVHVWEFSKFNLFGMTYIYFSAQNTYIFNFVIWNWRSFFWIVFDRFEITTTNSNSRLRLQNPYNWDAWIRKLITEF